MADSIREQLSMSCSVLRHKARSLLGSLVCLTALLGAYPQAIWANTPHRDRPDPILHEALQNGLEARPNEAADKALEAAAIEPRSRLAHWLRAQSVLTLAGSAPRIGKPDQDFIEEARARLYTPPPGWLPKNILKLSADQRMPPYTLLADLSVSRIYIFKNAASGPVLVEQFYTTLGLEGAPKRREGDRKTPIGVYRLLKEIENPRADGFLGHKAYTLDYPNPEDRKAGRTGSGIWIHGVPDEVHVRPPKASDGCLAISNDDMLRLRKYIQFGKTLIVIAPKVQWASPEEWASHSKPLIQKLASTREPAAALFDVAPDRPLVSVHSSRDRLVRQFWRQRDGQLQSVLRERL